MTLKEAFKILGVLPGTPMEEIKKQYRQLMRQVHPDVAGDQEKPYPYNAHEITAAYSLLREKGHGVVSAASPDGAQENTGAARHAAWDAPVNDRAFCWREILHNVHDDDGEVLGNFCIARGKYLWIPEEDFSLFLLSIYRCSTRLLDQIDASPSGKAFTSGKNTGKSRTPLSAGKRPREYRQQALAQLSYLLAQQFIDAPALLKNLAKEVTIQNAPAFYMTAMIEFSRPVRPLKEGQLLYPSAIRCHRLYLKDASGQELGYISFADDRLYYIVVPLFEQRSVSVKIQTIEAQQKKSGSAFVRYQKLHLWIRFIPSVYRKLPENLSLQISELLKNYAGCQ